MIKVYKSNGQILDHPECDSYIVTDGGQLHIVQKISGRQDTIASYATGTWNQVIKIADDMDNVRIRAHEYDKAVAAFNKLIGAQALSTTLAYALDSHNWTAERKGFSGQVAHRLTSSNWPKDE